MLAQQVSEWRDFYIVAATAAATLVGLLFVSLSLHAPATRGQLVTVARGAFAASVTILVVAFLFLAPSLNEVSLGVVLIVAAAINGQAAVARLRAVLRDQRVSSPLLTTVLRLGLSVLAIAVLAVSGILGLAGHPDLGLVAVSVAVLGLQAARSSWDLLLAGE